MATTAATTNPLLDLATQGQSIWYDNISRGLITSGELQQMIDDGVVGITSNPTIFEKAIVGSGDYDDSLRQLVRTLDEAGPVFIKLALDDIRHAADMLRPVYDRTDGYDGYISIEVSPTLAHDLHGTLKEARQLWAALNRPNIMIKVPATPEGIPAITSLIADGINVNVTMIFAPDNYREVANAYLTGLEHRLRSGQPISGVASVASIFVSRIDVAIDKLLEDKLKATQDLAAQQRLQGLMGKAAIANAKACYKLYQQIFGGDRFEALRRHGAHPQRLLWASSGAKNPAYRDVLYSEQLIGPDTVDTMPPATLVAFRDHGRVAPTLLKDLDQVEPTLQQLREVGVDLDVVLQKLQDDGVAAFASSYETLMGAIQKKLDAIKAEVR